MKNNILKIVIGIGIIILIFFLGRCTKECETETKTITITTPEVKGKFETPNVIVPESNTIKTIIQYRDTTLVIPQVNQELVEKYLALQQENDLTKRENQQLKLYTDAVSINNYSTVFDNDDIKLTINSKTEGKLLEIKPEYIIKSKTINKEVEVNKPKEKVFTLNVGVYSTYSKELKTLDPGIKLDGQLKNGQIISAGISLDKNILVSYTIPIFSIKK